MDKQRKILSDLAANLGAASEGFKVIKDQGPKIFNELITPEMIAEMSPEQKQFLNDSQDSFNFGSADLSERLKTITKTLKDHANFSN